jgi:lipopolysaccharide transport system permease protein
MYGDLWELQASVDYVPFMTVYADLIRYRELFGNLFRRDLQAKYKGSALGIVWVLLPPLVLMGVYLLVFRVLWRADIPHYALYLLAGLASWIFFATTVQAGSRAMLDNAALIRKTRFPRQLVAFSVVGTNLITYVVMLAILVVLCFVFISDSRPIGWIALALALLFVGFVTGIALALACLNVLFRDVEHLVAALLLPWFFLTPVLWDWSIFQGRHEDVQTVMRWGNPLAPPIQAIRDPLWAGRLPRAADVIYLVVATVVALALGAWTFRRVDDRIAVEL